jgi:hypothetical protein
MILSNHLLVGCSFTDIRWQKEIPWSIEYSKLYPSYIVAQAGMGIKGICTEAMYYMLELTNISKVIIILPSMWRMDIEMDQETYLCNGIVDLVYAHNTYSIIQQANRKWISSGGLHYNKKQEQGKIFNMLYKHQGLLVIAKEHFRALKVLLNYCKERKITYYISAIQDPLDQLTGLDYIRNEFYKLLDDVEYNQWFKFDGKFIDKFLGHNRHPTTAEHQLLCRYIVDNCNF